MNMRKRNLVIILTVIVLVVLGLWLFVFRKSSHENNQNGSSQSSAQNTVAKACDAFSTDDAKSIFGNDLSQVPSPDNEAAYTPPSGVADAPAAQTLSSSCMYVKGSVSPVESIKNGSDTRPSLAPAPKGSTQPADSTQSLDETKKEAPQPTSPPQILVNITLMSSTVENAKTDFNRAKPKTAQDVSGVGDSAFTLQVTGLSGKKGLALTILKGKTIINITGDNIDLNTAKKIAEIVLNKL